MAKTKPNKAGKVICAESVNLEKREKKLRKAMKKMGQGVSVVEYANGNCREFEIRRTFNMYNQLSTGRRLTLIELDNLILKGVDVECIKEFN